MIQPGFGDFVSIIDRKGLVAARPFLIGQIRESMGIGFGVTDLSVLTSPLLLNLQKVAQLGEHPSHQTGR